MPGKPVWYTGLLLAGVVIGAVIIASFLANADGSGQSGEEPEAVPVGLVGDQGPAILALPGLGNGTAPSWAIPGLRLTYKVQTATIIGTGENWKEDENGAWQTEDGRRWSPGEKGSNAAEGYLQIDVTALADGVCALYVSFYLISNPGEAPKLSFSYPVIGYAANAGGFWVNPAELKKAKNTVTDSLKVLRMPYTYNGVTHDAVWIQSLSDKGNMMYVYDEKTGVLLHDAVSAEGKESPVIGRDEVSNTPSTTLASGNLLSQRLVKYPWLGKNVTEWSSNPEPLRYLGTTLVPTAGGAPLQLGQELKIKPQGNGNGWVRYAVVLTTTNPIGMPPQLSPSETISGLGQFGGVYIPPSVLTTLTKGQKLDSDPITLTVVSVKSVSDSQVVLASISPAETLLWGYDRKTGLMNLIDKEDHNIYAPIRTTLKLAK